MRAARRIPPPIGCMSPPRWTKPRQASAPLHLSPLAGRGLRGGSREASPKGEGEGMSTLEHKRRHPLTRSRLLGASRLSPQAYGIHTFAGRVAPPPPPCGEDRLGRRPSEKGVAGHGAPCRRGTEVCQPQGPGLTDHVGLAPAADARRAGFDREPYARRPPPRSAFGRVAPPPQGGRGIAPRLCENPIAPQAGREGHAKRPCTNQRGSGVSR